MTWSSFLKLAAMLLSLSILGCGCGCGGGGGSTASSDASLADLRFSSGELDQLFQSNQTAYTASAGFLQRSVSVTAVAADAGASIEIEGTAVASGSPSPAIALADGQNLITVVVTYGEDSSANGGEVDNSAREAGAAYTW